MASATPAKPTPHHIQARGATASRSTRAANARVRKGAVKKIR